MKWERGVSGVYEEGGGMRRRNTEEKRKEMGEMKEAKEGGR
jgi:hypothetical protein